MKILLTAHQFLPSYTSGTEVLTFEVARELIRLGHQVRILTGWPNDDDAAPSSAYDEFEYEGIRIHRVHPPGVADTTVAERTRAEFDNPMTAAAFTALTAKWRPDIVHFFHLQRLSSSIPMRCVQAAIATVYTATDFWAICPLNQLRLPDGRTCEGPDRDSANCVLHLAVQGRRVHLAPLYRWVPLRLVGAVLRIAPAEENGASKNIGAARALQHRPDVMRRMLKSIDRVIAPTQYMAQRLREFGTPEESISELHYGIDTTIYSNVRPLLAGPRLRIGFIGTLSEHKGPHVLLEAMKLVPSDMPCEVSLYGDETFYPDYVTQLKLLCEGDERIAFRGSFVRDELPRVIADLDVLIIPSTWSENTPLVILAAQSAARPVVGSNVAGISEIVTDGQNGRLFEAGDAAALAAILRELVGQPEQLRAMAERARPSKDISMYTAELVAIYEEVLAARARQHLLLQKIFA